MAFLRTGLISVLCFASAVSMRLWGGDLPWQLWVPTLLLAGAGILTHHRHGASQLLVRAILWSNLFLGAAVGALGHGHERSVAALLGLTTGLALLALGRRGIDGDAPSGSFVPVAFHSTLVAILVMALADAQTFALFGSLGFDSPAYLGVSGAILLGLAAGFGVSIVAIYRLRMWGLLLNALTSLATIGVMSTQILYMPGLFRLALAVSAGIQLVLVGRLLVAMVTGAEKKPRTLSKPMVWLGTATIVAAMGSAIVPTALRFL